ncbi:MAG: AAA family ATPase [Phycisphaerales bacterium]
MELATEETALRAAALHAGVGLLGRFNATGILPSMRAIVTGQIGVDKKPYLKGVADLAGQRGGRLEMFHVGDLMYAEALDVRPGHILDLPLSRLSSLRRAAFKDIIAATSPAADHPNLIVNTHATFRWRHGLFSAFDFDQLRKLEPNMFICLVDNVEIVHQRLHRDHIIDATLKDCMVWREEEILATELMAQAMGCQNNFYILSRGRQHDTIETCVRLVTRPDIRKVYPSFPMSHVVDLPDVLAEIDQFRAALATHFIAFDPGDVDEKLLLDRALEAARNSQDWVEVAPHSFGGRSEATGGAEPLRVSVREVLDIAGDIDGQIYMRDFKLIDQSDMICSLIPELPNGTPGLSSGVERELQHAFEHTKEVYVVWKPRKNPSPFITETATKIFRSVDDALTYFDQKGMLAMRDLFGN